MCFHLSFEAHIEPVEEARPGHEPLLELDYCLQLEALPARGDVLDEGRLPASEEGDVEHSALRRLPPADCAGQIPCIHLVHLHDHDAADSMSGLLFAYICCSSGTSAPAALVHQTDFASYFYLI